MEDWKRKMKGDYMSEYIVRFHEDERGIVTSWDEVGKLVRCKDCEWWDSESKEKYRVCHNHNTGWKADDFCSYGKLRGNEE